jgi:hypothetical protein
MRRTRLALSVAEWATAKAILREAKARTDPISQQEILAAGERVSPAVATRSPAYAVMLQLVQFGYLRSAQRGLAGFCITTKGDQLLKVLV